MKELVIGFLGCGNVGGGVYTLLNSFAEEIAARDGLKIRIKKVLVRDLAKQRSCGISPELLTTDPEEVTGDPEISLVAEFMGGEKPASDYMLQALRNGKTVVTANKVALALNWYELRQAAEENRAGLYYEASVCGAIPIIALLQSSLEANRVDYVMGIINGTTNYILSRMYESGESYETALQGAQELGLAEPDPTMDVEGLDAAYKLSILATLAFHTRVPVPRIYCEGITGVTAEDVAWGREMGYVLKLLAIGKREGEAIQVRVHPAFLPKNHPMSQVGGSFNAVYLYGHACKEMVLQGRGAGDLPTASAVVADILSAARADEPVYPSFVNRPDEDPEIHFRDNWSTRFFVRLSVTDAPGVLATVTGLLAKEGISVSAMQQKDPTPDGRAKLVFVTHSAPEKAMARVVKALNSDICQVESVIRVED